MVKEYALADIRKITIILDNLLRQRKRSLRKISRWQDRWFDILLMTDILLGCFPAKRSFLLAPGGAFFQGA